RLPGGGLPLRTPLCPAGHLLLEGRDRTADRTAPTTPLPLSLSKGALARGLATLLLRDLHARIAGEQVVNDGKLGLAQALDLVAQPCGLLEVEIGGGVAHGLFEIFEMGLEIVADEVVEVVALAANDVGAHMVTLVDRAQDVADVLLDRLRRD